jgi:biopolymer transport protein TolQ
MTLTMMLALGAEGVGAPTHLDPMRLFLDADPVVQAVLAGLALSSVWVWMIIITFSLRMAGLKKKTAAYEAEFWTARDLESFQKSAKGQQDDLPAAKVVAAALGEWRRSVGPKVDRDAARGRLAGAMDSVVAAESESLADRLNFLATVGSVAPFVGLFGTVWGIMNSFFQIGQQQNSSLAVVAPGISEALFATAVGLFAAIPAVIAYNRFSHRVNGFEARLQRFADRFHGSLSRELDQM